MKDKICGIYMIRNKANGKVYIGQSVNINRRWSDHIKSLQANSHYNEYLQRAWNKYGSDNFEFSIVENCLVDDLNRLEIYYIADYYQSYNPDFGYNLTKGGDGVIPTEAVRKKMSDSKKQLYQDPEYIKRMSEAQKGKKASDETKNKMSNSQKEKWKDQEFRKKMSDAHSGKVISDETRQKIGDANRGKKYPERSGGKNHMARAVFCIELNKKFDSIKDAERYTGAKSANIVKCCSGDRNYAGRHPITGEKLHWVYADETNNSSVA